MQPKTAVAQKVVDLIQSKGGRFVQKEERENGKSRVNKPRGLYWPKKRSVGPNWHRTYWKTCRMYVRLTPMTDGQIWIY